MIKEHYIKNKVVTLMGALSIKEQAKRLERERLAARVSNLFSQELDSAMQSMHRHMIRVLHKTIKDEMR